MLIWSTITGANKRVFVLCEVKKHPPAEGSEGELVEKHLKNGCACVELKDFEKLDKMYDIDWKKMHDQICKYKKTYVYALLYGNWKGLDHWTHAYLKNKKISDLRQSFPADYKPQFCMEGKNTYGHTVRFEFVDVNRIDSFLNKYRSASGNARVVPDEPSN
ncbi:uncharacterized protein LOC107304530 [Oryza brachyantha]|uniref:uncharacterized protein LOC107304530 n=1 Tax=Oryza brachyantha TaxID=4533 RepID=UPI0007764AC0|nr:uncharacterized protein LOC107304530 [Oryza brachyantha]